MSPEIRGPNVSAPGEIDARDNNTGCANGRLRRGTHGFFDSASNLLNAGVGRAPVDGSLLPVRDTARGIYNGGGKFRAAQIDSDDGLHARQSAGRLAFQTEYPDLVFRQTLAENSLSILDLKWNCTLIE